MHSDHKFPLADNWLCDSLKSVWEKGWLDSFSANHFLICAINNNFSKYCAYDQTVNNSPKLYSFSDSGFCLNFCVNFSAKIGLLITLLGEETVRHFFEDQVSAGKTNYNEAQFFRALSEVELIRHYCCFNNERVRSIAYEPPLGLTGQNPEFRVEYENGFTIDVEVKTPGFDNIHTAGKIAVPTILLSETGRRKVAELCKQENVECVMPRVLKLRDRINESVDKFQDIQDTNHFNLLFLNWTYSDFPSQGYLEAYSLLANNLNGIFVHKRHGLELGLRNEVYDKISAIIAYSSPIETIVFQDFRYLWATRAFAIIPNPHLGVSKLDKEKLIKSTGMDSQRNPPTPYVLVDGKGDDSLDTIVGFSKICSLVQGLAK